jgi:hypothetical protein
MKKFVILLSIVAVFFSTTAFTNTEKPITFPGPGDGVTTCEVYGAPGVTATVVNKVITPGIQGLLEAKVKLNQHHPKSITVVVQLRDANYTVIESQPLVFRESSTTVNNLYFKTRGNDGEVYYVTINSASCN